MQNENQYLSKQITFYINNPTVSVIIPTYNRSQLLRRALTSVLNQSYRNFEVIVVDDNSQDATHETVQCINDNRIYYIKNEQSEGPSAARNKGISHARGEYVGFLDDDDVWMKHNLRKRVAAFKDYEVIICNSTVNGKALCTPYKKETVDLNDLKRGNIFTGGASVIMAKTSVLRSNLFDENLRMGEEWDLIVRLAKSYRVGYISEALVDYNGGRHIRLTNVSHNLSLTQLEDQLKAIMKHKEFLGDYFFNYRVAGRFLAHISKRDDKVHHIRSTIEICGVLPVLNVLYERSKKYVVNRIKLALFHRS